MTASGLTMTLMELGLSQSFSVVRVDYDNSASVTKHPVELGAEVTDHVQVMPSRITAEVLVTSTPLGLAIPFAIELARSFLETALGKLATVTIPGEGVFASMVLEGVTHGYTSVGARTFTLRFQQIRIASSVTVIIPPRLPAPVAQVGAATEAALGQQSTVPVPDSSALFDLRALLSPF